MSDIVVRLQASLEFLDRF